MRSKLAAAARVGSAGDGGRKSWTMNANSLAASAQLKAARSPRSGPAYRLGLGAAGFALALFAAPRPGLAAPEGGGAIVQTLYYTLLATMQNGGKLGVSGRYAQLAPVIRRIFDLPQMTRLSLGPAWGNLGDAQKQQMIDSFGRYISATY